jgi:hypothetical protein
VEYGTERDAAAAADDLAKRMGLPLDPETRHEDASIHEYRERGFLTAEEVEKEQKKDWDGFQKKIREVKEDGPGEPYKYAGRRWYLCERPRLEWRLFRKEGWRWYFVEWHAKGWMWDVRNFSLKDFDWRWHFCRKWGEAGWLRRVKYAMAIERRLRTEEEERAYQRESHIKNIEMFGGRMRCGGVERRPDGATVHFSYMESYDPEADEFLESDHSYDAPDAPRTDGPQEAVHLEDFLRQLEK